MKEIHRSLETPVPTEAMLDRYLRAAVREGVIDEHRGWYVIKGRPHAWFAGRREKERRARWMWRGARMAGRLIGAFPFVRGVFVSGELSRNIASRHGDVDFFIVTAPGRLWVVRSLLIFFKKIVLLNSRKFFCLNAFITTSHLRLDGTNLYLASETASLVPLCNADLLIQLRMANPWLNAYYPNLDLYAIDTSHVVAPLHTLQRVLERMLASSWVDRLDTRLMEIMKNVWERRYPTLTPVQRHRMYLTTKNESHAFGGDFETKVLALYEARLHSPITGG